MVMSAFKADFKLDGMRGWHRGPLKDKNCKNSFVVRFWRARRTALEGFAPAWGYPVLPLRAAEQLSAVPSKLLPFAVNLV